MVRFPYRTIDVNLMLPKTMAVAHSSLFGIKRSVIVYKKPCQQHQASATTDE